MTLNIPPPYENRLREAASAAGYDDVERFVIEELLGSSLPIQAGNSRTGGQWKGKVSMAPDFDELPDDLREAFGVTGINGTAD